MTKKYYDWLGRIGLLLWLLAVLVAANGWLPVALVIGGLNLGLDLFAASRVRCRRYNLALTALLYLADGAIFMATIYSAYQGRFLYILWLIALIALIERFLYLPEIRLRLVAE